MMISTGTGAADHGSTSGTTVNQIELAFGQLSGIALAKALRAHGIDRRQRCGPLPGTKQPGLLARGRIVEIVAVHGREFAHDRAGVVHAASGDLAARSRFGAQVLKIRQNGSTPRASA